MVMFDRPTEMFVSDSANPVDSWYKQLLGDVTVNGVIKGDRTGVGTVSVFGRMFRHKMSDGFPLLTSKKMYTRGVVAELLWFLKGSTDIRELWKMDCHIWDGDWFKRYLATGGTPYTISEVQEKIEAEPTYFPGSMFDLGPIYGKQWVNWGGELNQISHLIEELRVNPDSRRLMVTAWNPTDLNKMILPPCHYGFQCYTRELSVRERIAVFRDSYSKYGWHRFKYGSNMGHIDVVDYPVLFESTYLELQELPLELSPYEAKVLDDAKIPYRQLSLSWNQRSVDVPLGLPFNIASYGMLLELLAKEVNMVPGDLIGYLGDTHIYTNQLAAVQEQLNNETYKLPKLTLADKPMKDMQIADFTLEGYQSAGKVLYPLSN